MVGTGGWGRGEELVFHGDGVSAGEDEKVLETMVATVLQQWLCASCLRTVHLRLVHMATFMLYPCYHKKAQTIKTHRCLELLKKKAVLC